MAHNQSPEGSGQRWRERAEQTKGRNVRGGVRPLEALTGAQRTAPLCSYHGTSLTCVCTILLRFSRSHRQGKRGPERMVRSLHPSFSAACQSFLAEVLTTNAATERSEMNAPYIFPPRSSQRRS